MHVRIVTPDKVDLLSPTLLEAWPPLIPGKLAKLEHFTIFMGYQCCLTAVITLCHCVFLRVQSANSGHIAMSLHLNMCPIRSCLNQLCFDHLLSIADELLCSVSPQVSDKCEH